MTAAPRPPAAAVAAAVSAAVAVDVAVGAVAVVGAFGARQDAVLRQCVREPEAAELGGARVRGAVAVAGALEAELEEGLGAR